MPDPDRPEADEIGEPRTGVAAAVRSLRALALRHRRTFWILHSVWALITGAGVLVLAHERYGFVPWAVAFLGLTWLSTLFFARQPGPRQASAGRGFRRGVVSYLTRIMYQETLFFLLPFYSYSTTLPSANMVFVGLLAALAVLACLDLVFDRLLQSRPLFGLVFFATVAFAALNLLLPIFGVRPETATPVAAAAALLSGAALLWPPRRLPMLLTIGLTLAGAAAAAGLARVALPLVPPVPLRLQEVVFTDDFTRSPLAFGTPVGSEATTEAFRRPQVVAVATVFAPTAVPAEVVLEWWSGGRLLRTSRTAEILAHSAGFRVWDVLPAPGGVAPGRYVVRVLTDDRQLFGRGRLDVNPVR